MNKVYSLLRDINLSTTERQIFRHFFNVRKTDVKFAKIKAEGDKIETLHMDLNNIHKAIEIISEVIKTSHNLRWRSDSVTHGLLKKLKQFVENIEKAENNDRFKN